MRLRHTDRARASNLYQWVKWALYPGINLHARLRYRTLPRYFRGPSSDGNQPVVLDAGCGNGMLSYQSYLKGNQVVAVSIKQGEIERNRDLFNGYHSISSNLLSFRVHNLYDLKALNLGFDEIICTEVLEHIERDDTLCKDFFDALRPGGILHLCCPNAEHPDNQKEALDPSETGGHVRPGYTLESYRALLEPIGFRVSEPLGLGGTVRQKCNNFILAAQRQGGLTLGVPAFAIVWALCWLEAVLPTSPIPFCIYVRAEKLGTD